MNYHPASTSLPMDRLFDFLERVYRRMFRTCDNCGAPLAEDVWGQCSAQCVAESIV